jgi:hypothetical protein
MLNPRLAYEHLNLRRNPFGELTIDERRTVVDAGVQPYVKLLKIPRSAVQFIGGCGRGKTSHLLAILNQFPDAPYILVREGERPAIPDARFLIIDEFQRISPPKRCALLRKSVALAIGSHVDYSDEMRRAGLRIATVDLNGLPDAERLHLIFQKRIERARRSSGPLPVITAAMAGKLIDRFGSNIRAMECALYDIILSMKEIGDVKM